MIQWKERLYAFLIRKLVGPWLDEASWARLYQSIDVSLQDGSFVLRDVTLSTRKLTSVLRKPVRIRKATADKLEIYLSLQEPGKSEEEGAVPSSLAWRAFTLGSTHTPGAVSVVVRVVVEGLVLEFDPSSELMLQQYATKVEDVTEQASKGMFAAYMEAVLASLRLSVEVKDLEFRLYSEEPVSEDSPQDWLALRVQSLSYNDVNAGAATERNYETILQKSLDVTRISVEVGTSQRSAEKKASSTMVALLDGNSRFRLRMIEYRPQRSPSSADHLNPIQQDTEVSLGQKLNLFLDQATMLGLGRILRSYSAFSHSMTTSEQNTPGVDVVVHEPTEADRKQVEEDMETLDGIMKQYNEARRLAERKEIRGGMLVADDETMTYDAFFDANDKSVYRYSTMMSQCQASGAGDGDADFVHTKARLHLSAGSFKLAFGTGKSQPEYLLASFSDLNATSSVSANSSTTSLGLQNLDIEDSHEVINVPGGRFKTEISHVLQFTGSEEPGDLTKDEGELLLNSPCVSIEVEKKPDPDELLLNVSLEPIQFTGHTATLDNMSLLSKALSEAFAKSKPEASKDVIESTTGRTISLRFSCPSLDILLPLYQPEDLDSLFTRCGYVSEWYAPPSVASLGVHVDSLYIAANKGADQSGQPASLSCQHLIIYALSPVRKKTRTQQCQVIDLLSLSGSSSPLSLNVHLIQVDGGDSQENQAVNSFPLAPTIASFKARQEDEDEENDIDRVLLSKMGDMGIGAKRELRGKDPQTEMLKNCQRCGIAIDLRVPHAFGDLSASEYSVLKRIFASTTISNSRNKEDSPGQKKPVDIALNIRCDRLSFGIHADTTDTTGDDSGSSFLLKMKTFRAHSVISASSGLKHVRVSAHDFDLFEAKVSARSPRSFPNSAEARSTAVFQRLRFTSVSAGPILYRSRLYEPISRESPSILLDLLAQTGGAHDDTTRHNLYCTIYDLTYRHVDESKWVDDAKSLLKQISELDRSNYDKSGPPTSDPPRESLTRIFLALADCNLDYSTPRRFQSAARIVVRLGDLRCSSNFLLPAPTVQAFNVSIADLSLLICSSRYPYNFENAAMLDAEMLLVHEDRRHTHSDADAAFKHMNHRKIIMLDSMDAVIAVTSAATRKNIPKIFSSLTVGEISLFACKDSFWLLAQSVGEAIAEATAVTDEQIQSWKEQDAASAEDEDTFFDSKTEVDEDDPPARRPSYVNALDNLKRQSALRPAIGTKSSQSQKNHFLLDGYDWTTIDQSEPARRSIADDEEQSSRWYRQDAPSDPSTKAERAPRAGPTGSTGGDNIQGTGPIGIIPHHFPLRLDNDPLADGDMGAARYAGTRTSPAVSNRVLIHDMKVKMRLFDGYDWPELLSPESLDKGRVDAFLIDSSGVDDKNPDREEGGDILTNEDEDDVSGNQTTKLMADLLSGPSDTTETFKNTPLPEERGAKLIHMAKWRRLARRTGKYVQVSASGVCLRSDSMLQVPGHRLAACLTLKVRDFFVAETISGNKPVKMIGEWFSEDEHPRDSRDGLVMFKVRSYFGQTVVAFKNCAQLTLLTVSLLI
jgi:hypothetical protein